MPKVKETIDRVGISGLRTALRLNNRGGETDFLAEIDLFIDLDTERKGIHMSRLVESINEVVSKGSRKARHSFETLGAGILSELKRRHKYGRAEITMKTTMFMRRHTPVTGKITDEPYDVAIKVISSGSETLKNLRVRAIGNTLCPHSLETTGGKAHVQRAELDLQIETSIKEKIPLEELIEICDKSFSTPTYTVLKTVDEAALVEDMFRNPKFVEDVARDCFKQTKNLNFKGRVKIRATSLESIHKHNAISEIERVFE
ncbi:MAG: GTP cyclohydrolase I FolE2 [Thaumarchaeota archaeon]|nr:GTP cyclohydrolase I FolE2 [Nitrososphaerota archaeon]